MRKLMALCLFAAVAIAAQPATATPPLSEKGWQDKLETARQRGYEFLQNRINLHEIPSVEELKTKRLFADEQGQAHLHVQQTLNGVPVFGAEAIVHFNDNNEVSTMTDDLVSVRPIGTIPSLNQKAAAELAVDYYGCADCLTDAPVVDLWILPGNKKDSLAYRIQLRREDGSHETSMPVIFVDAHSGKLLWSYDNLQTATGVSLYSGSVTINTYYKSSSATYYMEDISRKVGTFDNRNTTSSTYRFTDPNNFWDSTSQKAGVDAHYGAAKVYDYFYNTHGRRGIDGNGGPAYYTSADGVTGLISSKVHYGTNYNNAFWNGSYMTYGDGDGTSFRPLVTLDICGHEMQHGITERTANLTYSGESGALNESWSDVFGAMVERYTKGQSSNTWKIGEDAYTPSTSGDALRYMDNPHNARNAGYTADDDPDHYIELYTGTGDNGGVHINSGIANKAFYMLAVGGTHHRGGSMTGIGADAAAKIWYRALTSYMTSSTNFKGARTATLNAAAALYGSGSTNYNAVAQAWTICGVS
jgi:Zn-dependent metalloprotease